MSQPITHYFIAREALRNSDLWHDYAPYITLGTLGPDLFYLCNPVTAMGLNKLAKYSDAVEDLDSKQKVYENLADAIHGDQSFQVFLDMVSGAAPNINSEDELIQRRAKKQIAFAMGFYAHVITDCVIHPLVYRVAPDHWLEHPEPGYSQHKTVEASLDYNLSQEASGNPGQEAQDFVRQCAEPGNGKQLDEAVRTPFMQALRSCYPEILARTPTFERSETEDRHPLNQAYSDTKHIVNYLYEAGKILQKPWRLHIPVLSDKVESIGAMLDSRTEPYITRGQHLAWRESGVSASLTRNAFDLIDLAIAGVRCLKQAVEAYLKNPDEKSLQDILIQAAVAQNIPYFQESFNLDTGLPSRLNAELGLKASGEEWYDYGIEDIDAVYSALAKCNEEVR